MRWAFLLLLLAACGPNITAPTTEQDNAEGVLGDEAVAEEAVVRDETDRSTCERTTDCQLVYDNCGAPYGRRVGDNEEPTHDEVCPPAARVPTEATCAGGRCVATPVRDGDVRRCGSAADCVVIAGNCGAPWAVSASKREELEGGRRLREASINCFGYYSGTYDLPTACVENICVLGRR